MDKPKIGIVGNILVMESGHFPGMWRSYVNHDYVVAVAAAGAIPYILPLVPDTETIHGQLDGLDGLVFTGGYDIDPTLYGDTPIHQFEFMMPEVDLFNIELVREAERRDIPVLGICKGLQVMNVAFGGTLYQDVPTQHDGAHKHFQAAPRWSASHVITVEPESFLGSVFGAEIRVNSYHHQAVRQLAPAFKVVATSSDGLVEAIERTDDHFMCGVQFHPEMMAAHNNTEMMKLFDAFIARCTC